MLNFNTKRKRIKTYGAMHREIKVMASRSNKKFKS